MNPKHEYQLKAAITALFYLAERLCYGAEEFETFKRWVKKDLLGEE